MTWLLLVGVWVLAATAVISYLAGTAASGQAVERWHRRWCEEREAHRALLDAKVERFRQELDL